MIDTAHIPSRRGRPRKIAKPEDLLAAAFRVFSEKGFSAARLDDVAREAGVSKAALYLYFKSKQAIFEALVRSAVVPNVERLEGHVAGWQGSAGDLLRMLVQAIARVVVESELSAFPKLIIAEASNFPDLARLYRTAVVERVLGLLAQIIRRGIDAGEFRPTDPHLAARLVIAPLLFSAIWKTCFARHDPTPFDPAPLLSLHVDTLLRGLA
ncbi:MAG: TetR/AcrR family transcriptional regulator [Alphaproteobacteria bacterium]|nr:TetR/AcrR family transcriptional regulator [Alphaproteobacteria bacterium]